jgi:hypothetical protein
MKYLITIIALLIALPALAADPECVGPGYDEAVDGQYDARQSIRFCTPTEQADENNTPIADGELTRCVVTAAGQAFAITSSNRPGQFVSFDTPQSVKDSAQVGGIAVFCENSAGAGAPVVASNVRFRDASVPSVPTLRK